MLPIEMFMENVYTDRIACPVRLLTDALAAVRQLEAPLARSHALERAHGVDALLVVVAVVHLGGALVNVCRQREDVGKREAC